MLLIDAIAIVESGNKNVPGDHGAALSPFQMHRAAWEDVRARFGKKDGAIYLEVGERFEDIAADDMTGKFRARNAATGLMFILEERLTRVHQPVTPENIYACWNLGFEGFKHRHFNLKLCPIRTVQRARRVAELCRGDPHQKPHSRD